jgi:hypothetical protein
LNQEVPVISDRLSPAAQAFGGTTHSDGEPSPLLRYVPGIAGEAFFKKPQQTTPVFRRVGELLFHGDDAAAGIEMPPFGREDGIGGSSSPEKACYRTAQTSRPDKDVRTETAVDEP